MGDLPRLVNGQRREASGSAEHRADLARLKALAARLKRPGGVLWIVFPVSSRTNVDGDIDKAGAALGLLRTGTIALSRAYKAFRLQVAA